VRASNHDGPTHIEEKVVKAPLYLLCIVLLGCGSQIRQAGVGYYFLHPLLNEEWNLVAKAQPRNEEERREEPARKDEAKARQDRRLEGGEEPHPRQAAVSAQPLRGNDVEVMRREMVLSAQRLLDIQDSFTQDSFIRHVLVVNNLGLGDPPQEGTLAWLYEKGGRKHAPGDTVQPGDILFLGEGRPEMAVVAESVDPDGTVGFIGCLSGRVQRGVLSLVNRTARRDESSQKVLNSFVDKSRTAGSLLLGAFRLTVDQQGVAGNP
jgi:hypothetical protein